jgi:hypothetical protein
MPSQGLKEEKMQELAGLVRGWGKLLAEESYGSDGPGLDVDLEDMEELAVTMQQALLEGLCEELTQRQAGHLSETLPCPVCSHECEVQRPGETAAVGGSPDPPRRMQLRGGSFALHEPECYCRTCRRSFFPATDGAGH